MSNKKNTPNSSSRLNAPKSLSEKIRQIRLDKKLTLELMAELMHVSPNYIYQIERGKIPSSMFLDLLLCKFGLDADTFFHDIAPKNLLEEKSKKYFGPLVAGLSLTAPIAPLSAGSLAVGVGLTTIILRLCDAYRAKTEKALAQKMGIGKNMISNWKAKNEIPEKFIIQAAKDTKHPIQWLSGMTGSDFYLIVEQTVTATESILQAKGTQVPPEKKAKIISFLIKEFISADAVDENRIEEVIALASN